MLFLTTKGEKECFSKMSILKNVTSQKDKKARIAVIIKIYNPTQPHLLPAKIYVCGCRGCCRHRSIKVESIMCEISLSVVLNINDNN